jgi:hypothetical protein
MSDDDLDREITMPAMPPVPGEVTAGLRDAFRPDVPSYSAHLVGDSRERRDLAGTRGGAAAMAWSMSYRANGFDVIVDVAPVRSEYQLTGHVLCDRPSADTVLRLYAGDELVAIGCADEFEQFDLGRVAPVRLTLVVARPDATIELPIDLNAGAA